MMDIETLIAEFQKLSPDQKQVVRAFVLADVPEKRKENDDPRTLRELLSESPFARMEFDPPEPVRSPIRSVQL